MLRCAVRTEPRTVVVKRFDVTKGTDRSVTVRYGSERDGLALLDSLGEPSLAPRPLGADDAARVVVMQDLGDPKTLVQPLLGSDPDAAVAALRTWAECLGDLHARTAGRATGSVASPPSPLQLDGIDASPLGIVVTKDALEEIRDVGAAMASPDGFSAFIHGDPCPDNCYLDDRRCRFIDWEFGSFGHALYDGVYWHTQFPTCWCANRLTDQLADDLELAYRTALREGCPAARDDAAFDRAVAQASAARTFWLLGPRWIKGLVEGPDQEWGLATVRQRVPTRFRSFARVAERRGMYPALVTLARNVADVVDEVAAPGPLPLFPALRSLSP